jgi:hypothetical protein
MTVVTWDQLDKNQTDPEKIEEAINRLIAAHNNDPSAHLDTGQSLQSHKAQSIIDHVVGSVLADKQTMREVTFRTFFESLDGYAKVGSVSNDDFFGVVLYVEYGATNESSISSTPQVPINYRNSNFDMLCQIVAHFSLSNSHFNAWFGFLNNYEITTEGFGFIVSDGSLYCHVRCGTTTTRSDPVSCDLSADHLFRVHYSHAAGSVYFYIDNELVATISKPSGSWLDDLGPCLGIKLTQENDGTLHAADLFSSRSLL